MDKKKVIGIIVGVVCLVLGIILMLSNGIKGCYGIY